MPPKMIKPYNVTLQLVDKYEYVFYAYTPQQAEKLARDKFLSDYGGYSMERCKIKIETKETDS